MLYVFVGVRSGLYHRFGCDCGDGFPECLHPNLLTSRVRNVKRELLRAVINVISYKDSAGLKPCCLRDVTAGSGCSDPDRISIGGRCMEFNRSDNPTVA